MKYSEIYIQEFGDEFEIREDFKLVLADEHNYIGIDKENHVVCVVLSREDNREQYVVRTKEICFGFNMEVSMINEGEPKEFKTHVITCMNKEKKESLLFLEFCESLFSGRETTEDYILEVIKIMSNFFASKIEMTDNELQGLYSELFTIEYLSKDLDIGRFWQKNDRMKFDFSITDKLKIEVKSTTLVERKHHFKHDQLANEIYDIFVFSYLLRPDDAGYSLYDLINNSLELLKENTNQTLKLKKIMLDIDDNRLKNFKFSREYTNDKLRIFDAKKIPRFQEREHVGVVNAEYDCILENVESINKDFLINLILHQ